MNNEHSISNSPVMQTKSFNEDRATANVAEGKASGAPVLPVDLLGNLRRHWSLALAVFVGAMIVGTVVAFRLDKPSYYAESIVYVSPETPQVLTNDTQIVQPYDSYVDDEAHTITRYDIISDAVAKLPDSVRHRTGPATPAEVAFLQKMLEVNRIGSTFQVSIGLHGPKPENLADIVNGVTRTFLEKTNNENFDGRDTRLKTLKEDQQRLQSQISEKVALQMRLMQELGVATLAAGEGATNPFDSELQKLREELADARVQREAAEAAWIGALHGSSAGRSLALDSAVDDAIAQDPGLASLRTTLNSRKAALMGEMNTLTPSHPVYKKDKDELVKIDAQLQQLTAQVRSKATQHIEDKLHGDVVRTRSFEQQLSEQVKAKTKMAAQAAPRIEQASQLGEEVKELQTNSAAVDQRIRDLELQSSSPGSIHMFSAARVPAAPEKGKLRLMLAMTFFGSLVFSLVSVCYDTHIYNGADVRRVVGFHPIGILLNREEFTSDILEQYVFRLTAAIDQAVRTTGARTFVFTSVQPGGGTSTVVQALTRELATLDHKVLAILASENETPVTYSKERPQLILEAAEDKMEASSEPTVEISGTTFNPHVPRSAKGPSAVSRTLQNAAAKYDVVLIDAEPLMISADTEYLARNTDVTVLVVESRLTARRDLSQAAQLLERMAVQGVAVVLNKVSDANADSHLRHSLHTYHRVFNRRRHSSIAARMVQRREADAQQESEDGSAAEMAAPETGDAADTVAQ